MAVRSSPCLLSMILLIFVDFPNVVISGRDWFPEAMIKRCSEDGPAIRFPFRFNNSHQSDYHTQYSYPYWFHIFCDSWNQTRLKLPTTYSDDDFAEVEYIDYASQEISIVYPDDNCFRSLLLLQEFGKPLVNDIPFQWKYDRKRKFSRNTLLNCSSSRYCAPGGLVLVPSFQEIEYGHKHCIKMYDTTESFPDDIYESSGVILLKWSKPNCRSCEKKRMGCRFKKGHDGAQSDETECFHIPRQRNGKPKILSMIKSTIFTILSSLVLCSIVGAGTFYAYTLYKDDRENRQRIEKFLEDYMALKPSRYSYADIKKITNKFKDKLGQGAYGTVFKGKLSNEVLVAVKILNSSKGNGEEFLNEVATLGQIHHINVVRLVGYCAEGFRRALVYEFLPNDSLDKYISSEKASDDNSLSLHWETLQDIALGIAKGIEYLHQGCDQRILHFDIKPHNILLDHNFRPKVSDFGLAKLCSKDQSVVSMTATRGTIGYIAPEVFSKNFGNVSSKSDVYSFGMLLLEMVGGRKNTNMKEKNTDEIYYPEWIYNLLEGEDDLQIQIVEEGDVKIAKKLAIIGLWCIQWHPVTRPTMKVVVEMLEGLDELTMPPNPFASTNSFKTNTKTTARRMALELEAIAE